MDVISASQNDNKIAWYRNQTLGVDDFQEYDFMIYPVPSKDKVFIDSELNNIYQITIFDMLGQSVMQLEGDHREITISHLQAGMYFVSIKTDRGTVTRKIIKE